MGGALRPCIYLAPLRRYGASKTCTQTHTRNDRHNDEQNDQSHNFLHCSLRSHLAEIKRKVKLTTMMMIRGASMIQ